MKRFLKIVCIQMNAGIDVNRNLAHLERLIRQARRQKPDLIALPETFYFRGPSKRLGQIARTATPDVIRKLKSWAKSYRVSFLLGSTLESSHQKNRFYNTSLLIASSGKVVAKYRKIHLFDISLKGKAVTQESTHIISGRKAVTGNLKGIKMGLTICYDLRFPELFRVLTKKGSRIIFVPANFTYSTGKAHWETLLRARAIENQVYIVAPGQVGVHPGNKIRSFGTSLIVDPWGQVLARGSRSRPGVISAKLDLAFQKRLRQQFPVLSHRKM